MQVPNTSQEVAAYSELASSISRDPSLHNQNEGLASYSSLAQSAKAGTDLATPVIDAQSREEAPLQAYAALSKDLSHAQVLAGVPKPSSPHKHQDACARPARSLNSALTSALEDDSVAEEQGNVEVVMTVMSGESDDEIKHANAAMKIKGSSDEFMDHLCRDTKHTRPDRSLTGGQESVRGVFASSIRSPEETVPALASSPSASAAKLGLQHAASMHSWKGFRRRGMAQLEETLGLNLQDVSVHSLSSHGRLRFSSQASGHGSELFRPRVGSSVHGADAMEARTYDLSRPRVGSSLHGADAMGARTHDKAHAKDGTQISLNDAVDRTWHGSLTPSWSTRRQPGADDSVRDRPSADFSERKPVAGQHCGDDDEHISVAQHVLAVIKAGTVDAELISKPVAPHLERAVHIFMSGSDSQSGDSIGMMTLSAGSLERLCAMVRTGASQVTGTMPEMNRWLHERITGLRALKDGTAWGATDSDEHSVSGHSMQGRQQGRGWASVVGAKLLGFCILDAANLCLRGAAQVLLLNNPLTGLFVLAGLYVQSAAVATYGMLGLFCSTWVAWLLGMDDGLLHSGLYGYNGILVGLCFATFQHPDHHVDFWDGALVGPVVLYSGFSTLLFSALARLLVPYKVPPFTLPFNLAALMYLAGSTGAGHLATSLQSAMPVHSERIALSYDWIRLVEAVPKGIGQVYLADNTWTGVIMWVGMALCSPIAAMAATVGSSIGILTAISVGADPDAVYAGIWGYNAALGAITVGGMFYVMTWECVPFAAVCAVMCAMTGPFCAAMLSPAGVPAMTFPFCLVALVFYLSQGSMTQVIPVSLSSASVPEEHCRRLRLSRVVAASFCSLVASEMRQQKKNKTKTEEPAYRMPELRNMVSATTAKDLFAFLDTHGNGRVGLNELCCMLVRCGYGHVPVQLVAESWHVIALSHLAPVERQTARTAPGSRTPESMALLDADGLVDFICLRLLLVKKRTDIDAYLETLDSNDTGLVSLPAISQSLEAFGLGGLSTDQQVSITQEEPTTRETWLSVHTCIGINIGRSLHVPHVHVKVCSSRNRSRHCGHSLSACVMHPQAAIVRMYCQHSDLTENGEMQWWRLADLLQYSLLNSFL